jgi:hypothetical protein
MNIIGVYSETEAQVGALRVLPYQPRSADWSIPEGRTAAPRKVRSVVRVQRREFPRLQRRQRLDGATTHGLAIVIGSWAPGGRLVDGSAGRPAQFGQ